MAQISDSELTTIQNALVFTREALAPDQSPEGTKIKEKIVEAEQIVSGKLNKDKDVMAPVGGSAFSIGGKTKALFSMFHLTRD